MLQFFKSQTTEQQLNTEHINYLEKLIREDNYLDAPKMLKHINNLMTNLSNDSMPFFNRLEDINHKMMVYARKNTSENVDEINDPGILDAKIMHLRQSIERMKPVYEKKEEAKKVLLKNSFRIFFNEIKSMTVKSMPLLVSAMITFVIDTYTPFLEKLILYPTAHTICLIISFMTETIIIDKLLDTWKERIAKKQMIQDMAILKQCYSTVHDVNDQLNRLIIENPMPEIFQ